jgi:hypothetical protein
VVEQDVVDDAQFSSASQYLKTLEVMQEAEGYSPRVGACSFRIPQHEFSHVMLFM